MASDWIEIPRHILRLLLNGTWFDGYLKPEWRKPEARSDPEDSKQQCSTQLLAIVLLEPLNSKPCPALLGPFLRHHSTAGESAGRNVSSERACCPHVEHVGKNTFTRAGERERSARTGTQAMLAHYTSTAGPQAIFLESSSWKNCRKPLPTHLECLLAYTSMLSQLVFIKRPKPGR